MNKGKYEIVKGDVTNPQKEPDERIIIPHVCNDYGVIGAGVALALKKKWPEIEDVYKRSKNIGSCSFLDVEDNIIVVNMVAQNGTVNSTNYRPLKYHQLVKCMMNVKDWAVAGKCRIIAPKFGSDLARGDWNFIEELIQDCWLDYGINVTIYEWDG